MILSISWLVSFNVQKVCVQCEFVSSAVTTISTTTAAALNAGEGTAGVVSGGEVSSQAAMTAARKVGSLDEDDGVRWHHSGARLVDVVVVGGGGGGVVVGILFLSVV